MNNEGRIPTLREVRDLAESLKIDPSTYKGDHTLYGEEEEGFNGRVSMAVNDLLKNYSPAQLETLKYFYYILKITGNTDKDNPLLIDIEAFEDIIEPFVVMMSSSLMKEENIKLSKLTQHAQQTVEDLLISDFIYSPYKKEDDSARFVCITPELNYAMEELISLPEVYKIQTDIELKEGGKFDSAEIVVLVGEPPHVNLRLAYDNDDDVPEMVKTVKLDVATLAGIYYRSEYLPSVMQEPVGDDFSMTEEILGLLAIQVMEMLAEAMESDV